MLQLNLDKLMNFKIHDDCEHCGSLCETVLCTICHQTLKAGFDEMLADQAIVAAAARGDSAATGDSFVASNDDAEQKNVVNY